MDENLAQLIQQAEQLFNEEKYKDIIELLTDELLKQYNNAALYAWRARAYSALNEIEFTFLYADKAIEIDPSFPLSYFVRGNAWYEKKEYDKAINDHTKAIALDEKYAYAYNNRGIAWADKKEYDKARYDFSNAIALDEKYAAAYNNRGLVQHDKKEYDKAINDYNKAIALDEKYAVAYYNRALSFNAIQKFNEAKSDYEQYIRLTNNSEDYFSKVAQLNIIELDKKLADEWYKEISELISKIKKLLLFEQACVTHYTGLSASKAMILTKSKLRLSEGAFLNDTSEGKELFRY